MSVEILRNPVSALAKARKQSVNKALFTLVQACLLIGISAGVLIAKSGAFTSTALTLAATSALTVAVAIFAASVVFGYVLKITATNLGGKGGYKEGVICIGHMLVPISVSILVAAVFAMFPAGIVVSLLVATAGFAAGVSSFYRGIKEAFSTDMVVSLVAVSILIVSFFASVYVSAGLAALAQVTSLVPVVA